MREHRTGQPVGGVVLYGPDHLFHFRVIVHVDREKGAEDFLKFPKKIQNKFQKFPHLGQQPRVDVVHLHTSGLDEPSLGVVALPAIDHPRPVLLGALVLRVVDVGADALEGLGIDHRGHEDGPVADLQKVQNWSKITRNMQRHIAHFGFGCQLNKALFNVRPQTLRDEEARTEKNICEK